MNKVYEIYEILLAHFGPQEWWPGDTPFEIMVGAVLTQNTNWDNVSRAIDNLRKEDLLSFERLHGLPVELLAEKIRPAGYFNLKAARLKNLLNFINSEYSGSLGEMFADDTLSLREKILTVKGIGPETADSILLYAGNKPVFVVDAYTHRIFSRHDLVAPEDGYYEIQEYFKYSLPDNVDLFNEYHALIVRLGKEFCKKSKPQCVQCPLGKMDGFKKPIDI
ncbi:MAG: endonuclease III domain-containing protein [Deltaproteobacteria bacterium]|jgi:endonuclease-3 related protein|nr:endonuclease III domain-containing protein [Deltaproteobacteria bacterium]